MIKKHIDEILAFIAMLIFMAVVVLLTSCDRALRKEIEQLREELAKQQQYVPLQRDTIRDSIEVVTQKVVEVEKIKEVLSKEDKALLKDLNMKVSELEALQKIGSVTTDTVYLTVKDSTNNTLYYKDAWAEFEYQDRKLRYAVWDSIDIAIKREFKHRFLFWKWGVKGYTVKTVNFNPNSTIRYNTFVRRK